MIIISIFGYIIPHGYENSSSKGITKLQSDSMKPKFKAGDGIVYDKIDITLVKKDDLVVYYYMDSYGILANTRAMHRVIDITKDENGNTSLVTKGDNNTVIDEVNVTQKNYLGVYSHKALPVTNMFLRYDSSYIAPIYMPFIVLVILIISYMDFIQIKKKYFNN